MDAREFWQEEYLRNIKHHINQNNTIATDFIKLIETTPSFLHIFNSSKNMIEIGCGSGDMCYLLKKRFGLDSALGLDISENILIEAKKRYPEIDYLLADAKEDDLKRLGTYDICISSNVLEHFKDPSYVVSRFLEICRYFIALVPYMQPLDIEPIDGGGGHIFTFSRESFNNLNLIDAFIFKTEGWVHSAQGEEPKQLAVLLKGLVT